MPARRAIQQVRRQRGRAVSASRQGRSLTPGAVKAFGARSSSPTRRSRVTKQAGDARLAGRGGTSRSTRKTVRNKISQPRARRRR